MELVHANQKIQAVKVIRDEFGWGLLESKLFMEGVYAYAKSQGFDSPNRASVVRDEALAAKRQTQLLLADMLGYIRSTKNTLRELSERVLQELESFVTLPRDHPDRTKVLEATLQVYATATSLGARNAINGLTDMVTRIADSDPQLQKLFGEALIGDLRDQSRRTQDRADRVTNALQGKTPSGAVPGGFLGSLFTDRFGVTAPSYRPGGLPPIPPATPPPIKTPIQTWQERLREDLKRVRERTRPVKAYGEVQHPRGKLWGG